jgi:pilus assembly protein CpaB
VSRFQRRSVPAKTGTGDARVDAVNNLAGAVRSLGPDGQPAVSGPSVRVARGNTVTVVPVGAR